MVLGAPERAASTLGATVAPLGFFGLLRQAWDRGARDGSSHLGFNVPLAVPSTIASICHLGFGPAMAGDILAPRDPQVAIQRL